MKVNIHFHPLLLASIGLSFLACAPPQQEKLEPAPQAVRAAKVRVGPLLQGRSHLAEVVPEQSVKVIAQVPGTVTSLAVAEGGPASYGAPLVLVSAPDVAARVARVRSERKRAERERDFACSTMKTDRVLAKSGDLSSIALERSERVCASATLAAEGAKAGEREASVAKAHGVERAPFDGEVLMHLVDEGQTVMPGSPLLQFASQQRLLRIRVPESDLKGIEVGTLVQSEMGGGHIASVGAQAVGPGRVVELLIKMDQDIVSRVGTTHRTTLVTSKSDNASAVPDAAIAGVDLAYYVLVIEDQQLRRVDVELGVRQGGWTEVLPALPKGTQVVALAVATLDPALPVLVVGP